MSEEKNIDRLFQEKLKDFEVTPRDTVWENIAAQVQPKKKKRRVIPLWLRISGVAASLLLMLALGSKFFTNNDEGIPTKDTPVIVEEDRSNQESLSKETDPIEEQIVDQNNNEEITNSLNGNDLQEKVTTSTPETKPNGLNKSTNTVGQVSKDEAQAIAATEVKEEIDAQINNNSQNVVAQSTDNSDISATETEKETIVEDSELQKESIIDAVASNEDENIELDEPSESSRWSISPNIAPVYFNSLGEGSSIHRDFNSNPKTGDVNMSYGIAASYEINDRLSVRTGVNKVQLGYSTNEILVFNSLSTSIRNLKYRNINLNRNVDDISFASANTFNPSDTPLFVTGKNASIDQQLGFLEVPLELEYKLLDNKLGLHVVGGFSALFLESNNLYSILDGESMLIGKATNINNTSYSANLGFGLDYKMSNKINLNLEPVFKYQLNTFTNTSGEFRPYFIGFYTGLSFKF